MTKKKWIQRALVLGVWVSTCMILSYITMAYDFHPGNLGAPLQQWPEQTLLSKSPEKTTVVAFIHPRCVCTKASIKQLISVLHSHPEAELIACIFIPSDSLKISDPAWIEEEHIQSLRTVFPQTQIFYDQDGIEATRFGAFTSGTILTYTPNGQEIFRGGITDRRGGVNENPGLLQFRWALKNKQEKTPSKSTLVFGCPIFKNPQGAKNADDTR